MKTNGQINGTMDENNVIMNENNNLINAKQWTNG